MKNLLIKTLIVTILLLLPYIGISNAVYSDKENSSGNSFSVDSLDFELRDESNNLISGIFIDQKVKKDEEIQKSIKIVKNGNLSFFYFPKFEFKSGEEEICSKTSLIVKKDGQDIYLGALSDFDLSSESAQLTGVEDLWKFTLKNENTDVNFQSMSCGFDIKYFAYQSNLNKGFSDTEKLVNEINFPYEPTISLTHDTTLYKLIINLGNLSNFLSFDYTLDYITDTIADHAQDSVVLNGENTKTIEIDLGIESDGVLVPHINPHNFNLNMEFLDKDNKTIKYQEKL